MEKVFIGIDFSKLHFDVVLIGKGTNAEAFIHSRFMNSELGCQQMLVWLNTQTNTDQSKWLFCGEHTGLYCVLVSEYLHHAGLALWLESGLQIKRSMGICRGKTDKIDAHNIALYALRFEDKARIYHPKEDVLDELKDLQAYRSRLVDLKVSSKELFRIKQNGSASFIREDSLEKARELALTIKSIDAKVKTLIESNSSVRENFELLTSIKGIGLQNATMMLVLTDNFQRFTDPRKFGCYCGVVPSSHNSGSSVRGRDRVSPLGNRKMKVLLTQATHSASRHDNYFNQYYKRKVHDVKDKILIINNIKKQTNTSDVCFG
ncbi:transposase [Dysgonomonas alginatilytica]|uniref:Transposase n=1 Tax=Dysgonomonas alginatilytica TaxID=1605892 RepID=A0A2V3PJQ8_9BACT|nr:transposase [Dysgonomonas alginatilytica]PXV58827.1 transposase [Dysgonomonas alginatilytica]